MDNTDTEHLVHSDEEIHIEYGLTEQEYVRGIQAYYRQVAHPWRNLAIMIALTGLGLLYTFVLSQILLGGLMFATALVGLAIPWYVNYQLPRKRYREDLRIGEPGERWFSPEGVRIRTSVVNSSLKWSAFQGFWETPDLFLLRISKIQFVIIPRRAFVQPGSVERFRQLLQQRVLPPAPTRAARRTLIGTQQVTDKRALPGTKSGE